LLRLQIGLEDGLQDQHCRHLHDTVLERCNPQRSLLAVRFGNVDTPHRTGTIRLRPEFFRQFAQPLLHAIEFDVRERLAVDARRAAIPEAGLRRDPQHVVAVQLVVQCVEAKRGRSLRFGMQRRLQLLNLR